jgi:hypothetical protein
MSSLSFDCQSTPQNYPLQILRLFADKYDETGNGTVISSHGLRTATEIYHVEAHSFS